MIFHDIGMVNFCCIGCGQESEKIKESNLYLSMLGRNVLSLVLLGSCDWVF